MSEALSPQTGAEAVVGNHSSPTPSQQYGDQSAQLLDQGLAAAAAQGDQAAFEKLIHLHGPRLYQLLLRMAGNPELANDLFQDVLFHVWQRLDKFAGKSAFGTWLWSVGRNRALDQLRKRQPQTLDPTNLPLEDPRDRVDTLDQSERKTLLHQALAGLSEEAREIIILRDFQDHDYPSIAAMLDIAEGTVKSRLSRARAQLRKLLEPHLKAGDL